MKYILNSCCRDIYKRQQDLKIKDGYYCRILKKVYFYRILKHYHSGPRKICFPQCIKVLLVMSPTTVQCQKLSFVNIWQLLFALSCLLLTETTWTIILVIFGKSLRVKLTYNISLFMRWIYTPTHRYPRDFINIHPSFQSTYMPLQCKKCVECNQNNQNMHIYMP